MFSAFANRMAAQRWPGADYASPAAPFLAEILLLLVLVLATGLFGAVEPWAHGIVQAVSFLALAAAYCARGSMCGPRPAVLSTALLAFAGVGLLQLGAQAPVSAPSSLLPGTVSRHATTAAFLQWLSYAAVVASLPAALRDAAAVRRLFWAVFLLGAAVALLGIIQQGQGNRFIYGLRPVHHRDPFGPFYNRNHAAAFMGMSAAVGVGLFASLADAVRRARGAGRVSDLLGVTAVVLFLLGVLVAGIVASKSRGSLLSAAISLPVSAVLYLSTRPRRTRWKGLAILGAMMTPALLFAVSQKSIVSVFDPTLQPSAAYRLSMLSSFVDLWKDHPLFGIGLGGVAAAFPYYQDYLIKGIVEHIHADWPEICAQGGLVGALALAFGVFKSLRRAVVNAASDASAEDMRPAAWGGIAACIFFLCHGLFEFSLQTPANAILFFVLLGALCRPMRYADEAAERPAPRLTAWSQRAAHAAAMLLAAAALRPAAAAAYALQLRRAELPAHPAILARAHRIYPDPVYQYRIGWTFAELAQRHPAAAPAFLRSAVEHSNLVLRTEPHSPKVRYVRGYALYYLNRKADARPDLAVGLWKDAQGQFREAAWHRP